MGPKREEGSIGLNISWIDDSGETGNRGTAVLAAEFLSAYGDTDDDEDSPGNDSLRGALREAAALSREADRAQAKYQDSLTAVAC